MRLILMAIIKKKLLKAMAKQELDAKLVEIENELKRVYVKRDKNTAKKKELNKVKSRILNYLQKFAQPARAVKVINTVKAPVSKLAKA